MEIILKYFPELTSKQIDQFLALKDLYTQWNNKINVISRKDIANFYERHILHSLAIAKKFCFADNHRVMDLGSGGGFPGIPLAIVFPQATFHLVDSINKKLKVASEIALATGLTNIETQHTRAEKIKGQRFDVVVSRAVAPLQDLWKWSKPLIADRKSIINDRRLASGLICLKGGDLKKEIHESGQQVKIYEIENLFEEPFFSDKYVLQIAKAYDAHKI